MLKTIGKFLMKAVAKFLMLCIAIYGIITFPFVALRRGIGRLKERIRPTRICPECGVKIPSHIRHDFCLECAIRIHHQRTQERHERLRRETLDRWAAVEGSIKTVIRPPMRRLEVFDDEIFRV